MKGTIVLLSAGLLLASGSSAPAAETLHFLVMSPTDPEREAEKYESLSAYLRDANPLLGDIKLRVAQSFPEAARLFEQGDIEGMFSASFVAAVFIARGVARPVARPLRADGGSTYSTLVVAKRGAAPYRSLADLAGKRVAYCRLASAGEVYLRSLLGPGGKLESACLPVPVDTHQAALEAVQAGAADYAVVKNTVFAPARYPGLAVAGADDAQHPDNTFVMPREAFDKVGALISRALLGLGEDPGEKAEAARQAFGCTGFVPTVGTDFGRTFVLLRRAGVDPKTFAFSW